MRVASHPWPIIAGLSLVVGAGLTMSTPALAWQTQFTATDETFEGPPFAMPSQRMYARPAGSNWTNDANASSGVQQVAWNSSTQGASPRRKGNLDQTDSADGGAAATGGKPPLFHGYNLKMPGLPFTRPNANARATSASPAASGPQTGANGANRATIAGRLGFSGGAPSTAAASPRSSLGFAPKAAPTAPLSPSRSAKAGPNSGSLNAGALPPPSASTSWSTTAAGSSRPSPIVRRGPTNQLSYEAPEEPNTMKTAATASQQPLAGPMLAPAAEPDRAETPAAPVAVASSNTNTSTFANTTWAVPPAAASPADRLLLSAHEMAASAQSESELSRVIETCRRARASRPSAEVAQYAGELVGWAMNRRGQLRAEAGRTKEALLDFDDAVRHDAKCWRAIHNRGVLLAQAGQFEKAFDDFNRTVQLNPDFAKAYSNRAALFVVAGDVLPAMEDYNKAIELDPNLSVAHRGRGRVCHLLGRLDDAIGHYDAAVQLAPDDAYAVASRADLMTDLGRYAEAAKEYERAIEIDPNSVHAFRGSAWLLATCPDETVRDAGLAVERAEMAMRFEGEEDSVTIDTLAAAQASGGDFETAAKTLARAIELAPDSELEVYQDRLLMYQHAKPYRIAPLRTVAQASYEQR